MLGVEGSGYPWRPPHQSGRAPQPPAAVRAGNAWKVIQGLCSGVRKAGPLPSVVLLVLQSSPGMGLNPPHPRRGPSPALPHALPPRFCRELSLRKPLSPESPLSASTSGEPDVKQTRGTDPSTQHQAPALGLDCGNDRVAPGSAPLSTQCPVVKPFCWEFLPWVLFLPKPNSTVLHPHRLTN